MFQAYDAELQRLAELETIRLEDGDVVVVENQGTSSEEGYCHSFLYLLYLFETFITCIFLSSLLFLIFVYFPCFPMFISHFLSF